MESTSEKQSAGSNIDRVQIISMLYDGAANFNRIAKKKLEVCDSSGKSLYIGKTSAIITELSNSLNMDGGDVSRNLRNLYDYVLNCLITADANNDIKALDDAEKVIDILRNAWKEMQDAAQV